MRVLTTASVLAPLGGIETCTLDDAKDLARRGHKVELVYGRDGPHRREYEESGVRLHGPVELDFDFKHPLRSVVRFWRLGRRVRSLGVDVVWLNRSEQIIGAQIVAWRAHVPLICHLHQPPNFSRLPIAIYSRVARFVAVSEFAKALWVARGIDPERIAVVRNAVALDDFPTGGDEERSAARKSLGLPATASIVLYTGRATEEKGALTLIRAWRELSSASSEALLVFVGTPSPRDDPLLWRELNLLPEGSYRCVAQQSTLVPYLHAADIVAVPSQYEEVFGRVILEALATGRPVVASRIGGITEVLDGPMSRFLVEPRDPHHLARSLGSLLHWRRTQPSLARECRTWVHERFPYEAHVDGIEAVLLQSLTR